MTATITDIDADRRHFADFLTTKILHYVQHRYAVWPFAGEDKRDTYRWATTDGNKKFRPLEAVAVLRHLTGIKTTRGHYSGIGIPALADAGWAGVGVLDIDTHSSGTVLDLAAVAAVCDPAALVTRSSSGRGAHVYFFPPVPVNSHVLRLALDRYVAYLLGSGVIPVGGTQIDVFPKGHGTPAGEPAERIMSGGSVRFPFAAGRRVNFETYPDTWAPPCEHPGEIYGDGVGWVTGWGDMREHILRTQRTHLAWLATWAGPPCVGTVLKDGADEGERNTLIYDAAYFAAFATHDEATTVEWVWDRFVPRLRGSEILVREAERTIRSGIEHALDSAQPQYVCTTSLCDKKEGRCMRLGQPTPSGAVAGTMATIAAKFEQDQATVTVITEAGPNALTMRLDKLYIGETAVETEYCPIDERYYLSIGKYTHRFTPVAMLNTTALGILSSMLQREVMLPRNAQRGWLTKLLVIVRQVAVIFRHPAYGQLKSALYTITQTEGDAVRASAIHDALQQQRNSISIDAAIRYYPGTDWRPVISPENEVLGMRLVRVDPDFLTIVIPPPPAAPAPEKPDATDY